jgi:hypothetical protein
MHFLHCDEGLNIADFRNFSSGVKPCGVDLEMANNTVW